MTKETKAVAMALARRRSSGMESIGSIIAEVYGGREQSTAIGRAMVSAAETVPQSNVVELHGYSKKV